MNNNTPKSPKDLLPSRKKTLALMVSAALGVSQVAQADLVLEEVIVTASKRKANLQDLPQAITAFTTEDIVRQGFKGIDDYANKIPSLSFARREPGGTSVVFRGAAASGIQFGTNPSSGVYLDEQPITQAGVNPDPKLIDIERIEALSGPQGTLFGDASQSGTLRIITNKPDTSEMSGWVEGSVAVVEDSDDLDNEIAAMVNVPIIEDTLAIRLVGFRSEEAGYIDNVLGESQADVWESQRIANGLPVRPRFDNADVADDDVNSSETIGGRIGVRWLINDDWSVDIAGTIQNTETDGFGDVNLGLGDREQVRFNEEGLDDDWYQLSITLEGDLGFADALLTTSYFNRDFKYEADDTDYLHDFDQKYDPSYFAIYDFTGAPRATALQELEDERYTVEGRLTTQSDSDSRWDGLVGFFYGKLEREQFFSADAEGWSDTDYYANQGNYYLQYLANSPYYNPNYDSFHGQASDNFFFGVYDLEVEQVAIFGEATFHATEKLSITAGARWFEYDQDYTLQQGALLDERPPVVENNYYSNNEVIETKDDDWVPKLNISYDINDDIMGYFTYSEGFRRGGGNAIRASSILPVDYESDKLENYELGFKSTWMDGALRFNAVVYQMIWNDMQIQINDPTVFSLAIENFSEAEINGFEADFGWIPAEGWDISANLAIIDAEISEDNEITAPGGDVIAFVEKGTQLPITPENKGSIAVEYTFPDQWMGGIPYVRVDWAFVGDSVNSLNGTESIVFTQGPTDQPSYNIGNLRMGLESEEWEATLYVHNITDEVAEQFYNNRWGSNQRLSINKPRTIGASVRWKF
jgi:outer membrane receptor protein involved in Fe transport